MTPSSTMVTNEALSRVQHFHESRGPRALSFERRDETPRGRVQKTGRSKPAQARTEAKGQATFLLPRPCRLEGFHFFCLLFVLRADEFGISEPFADYIPHQKTEAVSVAHRLAVVEPKCLFIDVE